MKVAELKEKAKNLGIKGYYKLKKQELLDTIKEEEEKINNSSVSSEKVKDNYYIKLQSNSGSITIPIINIESRHAILKEFKECKIKLDKNYPVIELYNGDKLLRRERRRESI